MEQTSLGMLGVMVRAIRLIMVVDMTFREMRILHMIFHVVVAIVLSL
jgi:hypothetical protein